MVNEFIGANRARWDELVDLHLASDFYSVDAFRAGGLHLDAIERAAVGDVAGRSLLHLQCHFGLETLSWARLGATVTGVDFSPAAISAASALAHELRIDAGFLCCELDQIPRQLDAAFDVVFASYGSLCWLPDLATWAAVAARCLRPGGRLHVVELHPFACMFDDESDELRIEFPTSAAKNRCASTDPGAMPNRKPPPCTPSRTAGRHR